MKQYHTERTSLKSPNMLKWGGVMSSHTDATHIHVGAMEIEDRRMTLPR